MNEPSPQHRAECDCREFYGEACRWPECEGMRPEVFRKRAMEEYAKIQRLKLAVTVGILLLLLARYLWKHYL